MEASSVLLDSQCLTVHEACLPECNQIAILAFHLHGWHRALECLRINVVIINTALKLNLHFPWAPARLTQLFFRSGMSCPLCLAALSSRERHTEPPAFHSSSSWLTSDPVMYCLLFLLPACSIFLRWPWPAVSCHYRLGQYWRWCGCWVGAELCPHL